MNKSFDLMFSTMMNMQSRLQKQMFDYDLPNDSIEDFKYSLLGLIGELGEVLDADRRWKNIRAGKYSREEKLDELVDCMAFLVNMILFSGYTSDEFCEAFSKKNNKNFDRLFEKERK